MSKQLRVVACHFLGALCLSILLPGCGYFTITSTFEFPDDVVQSLNSPPANTVIAGDFTHVIHTAKEQYYLNGPQQAQAADGNFPKGTRVKLIREAGSYSIVQSESGITAHVTTGCLQQIGKD